MAGNSDPIAAAAALRREAWEQLATAWRAARKNAQGDEQVLRCIDRIRNRILTARIIEPHGSDTTETPPRPANKTTLTHTIMDTVWSKKRT